MLDDIQMSPWDIHSSLTCVLVWLSALIVCLFVLRGVKVTGVRGRTAEGVLRERPAQPVGPWAGQRGEGRQPHGITLHAFLSNHGWV